MKELETFRKFLAEGQLNENLDPQSQKTLEVAIDNYLTQDNEGPSPKAGDILTYNWEDEDGAIKSEIPGEFVKFNETSAAKFEVKKVGKGEFGDKYEFKVTVKVDVDTL